MLATNRRIARSVAAAAVLAAAALATGACGAGQVSQTAVQVPAVNGNSANAGQIALRDVRINFPGALGADPAAYTNKKDGRALLLFSAVNTSPHKEDTLTSISTDAGRARIVSPIGSDQAQPKLAPQRTLVAGAKQADAPAAQRDADLDPAAAPILVEITDLSRDLTPGLTVPVTFTFAGNGPVTVQVPIDAADVERKASSTQEEHPKHE
ncbi:MAG: hypothetical protein HOQ24_18655 [Mycobacteriaceae bacterium]|nr:hypothetical protein [Mycobacteriaceae bacterium]